MQGTETPWSCAASFYALGLQTLEDIFAVATYMPQMGNFPHAEMPLGECIL
jgi:hypothetical protein